MPMLRENDSSSFVSLVVFAPDGRGLLKFWSNCCCENVMNYCRVKLSSKSFQYSDLAGTGRVHMVDM